MRYSINHLGVPIGTVDLTTTETAIGELVPSTGYAAVQETVRSASESLWASGFLGSGGSDKIDPAALNRAQALPLELRDERGAFVPADFINIVERQAKGEPPVVFVRFRLAPAQVASTLPSTADRAGGSA